MDPATSTDLRSSLARYEQAFPEDVWRVHQPVDVDYTTTAYVFALEQRQRSPVVIFERLNGFPGRLVANLFGSRERIARLLGTDLAHLHETWAARVERRLRPTLARTGLVQQVVRTGPAANLLDLPVPKHFLDDAGPYVTSGVCVARDPETGRTNLSYARLQVKGPDRLGLSLHSRGHLWDFFGRAEQLGRSLEMAVVIGPSPEVMLAAAARVSADVDEYELAGALRERPVELVRCTTIDVGVPRDAEIVIEGEILAGVREPEGPFGEYTGYSTSRSTQNVFQVRAITHREDPVYLEITPGFSSEHLLIGRIHKETTMLRRLREVLPNVTAIHYPKSGTHFHCYLAMRKQLEGQPQQAATLLLGLDHYVKLVVVVDDDIDVNSEEQVLWAVATRVQPGDDTFVLPPSLCNLLDPSSRDGRSSKLAIDATAPLNWDATRHRLPGPAERDATGAVAAWLAGGGAADRPASRSER